MFRPLKAETYAQFGRVEVADAGDIIKGTRPGSLQGRQIFNQAIAERMSDAKPCVGDVAQNREYRASVSLCPYAIPPVANYLGNRNCLWNDHWGLQWAIDIPNSEHVKAAANADPNHTNDALWPCPWNRLAYALGSENQGARIRDST